MTVSTSKLNEIRPVHEFSSFAEFEKFLKEEEREKGIEFSAPKTKPGKGTGERLRQGKILEWTSTYYCSRKGNPVLVANPLRKRKKPSKKVGKCPCKMTLRKYKGSETVTLT